MYIFPQEESGRKYRQEKSMKVELPYSAMRLYLLFRYLQQITLSSVLWINYHGLLWMETEGITTLKTDWNINMKERAAIVAALFFVPMGISLLFMKFYGIL